MVLIYVELALLVLTVIISSYLCQHQQLHHQDALVEMHPSCLVMTQLSQMSSMYVSINCMTCMSAKCRQDLDNLVK